MFCSPFASGVPPRAARRVALTALPESRRSHWQRPRRTLFVDRALRAATLAGGNTLQWAVIFFIIAIIAALLGLSAIAASAAGIAKILFGGGHRHILRRPRSRAACLT